MGFIKLFLYIIGIFIIIIAGMAFYIINLDSFAGFETEVSTDSVLNAQKFCEAACLLNSYEDWETPNFEDEVIDAGYNNCVDFFEEDYWINECEK